MQEKSLTLGTLLNRPLAIEAGRAEIMRSRLLRHGPDIPVIDQGAARPQAAELQPVTDGQEFGYWGVPLLRDGNVAVIPICGVLLSGPGGWLYPYISFYEDIREKLTQALDDSSIQAIALWIDSPGGVVSQCFELADFINLAARIKPVASIVYDTACSAAYALAAATSTITLPETGVAGSIGVIMIHSEYSEMLERAGVKTTIFRYGAHKAELQEVEPISPDAAIRAQAMTDQLGEMFVFRVAQYRSQTLTPEKIRAQQGEVYLGEAAREQGLVDNILPPHDALEELIRQFS